ncbi:MAG: lipoprotein [Gammaproteobacteria bacterium]|nr:lipoprotein [Gammaproteobacteria bacterium]
MLAHLRSRPSTGNASSPRMPASRRFLTGAALSLGLALSGCGFSGALYLPEENPPPPAEEPPVPQDEGPATETGT